MSWKLREGRNASHSANLSRPEGVLRKIVFVKLSETKQNFSRLWYYTEYSINAIQTLAHQAYNSKTELPLTKAQCPGLFYELFKAQALTNGQSQNRTTILM